MGNIFVTFIAPDQKNMDLALPDHIPSQFIANALANINKLSVEKTQICCLEFGNGEFWRDLSPGETLEDGQVINGHYIRLKLDAGLKENCGWLRAENGLKFPLKKNNLVGRQDAIKSLSLDIDLSSLDAHRVVSRIHATIMLVDHIWMVLDEGSKHGTWVNQKHITAKQRFILRDGDVLEFGLQGKGVRLHLEVHSK